MSEVSGGRGVVEGGAAAVGAAASARFSVSFDDPLTGVLRLLRYPPPSPSPSSPSPSPSPLTFDLGSLAACSTSLLYVLTLTNDAPHHPLHLSLRTSPPDVLALQLHNENMRDGRMVPASSMYQLFNEVDYIDRVTLPPSTSTPLILVVHPHLALPLPLRADTTAATDAPSPSSRARSPSPPPASTASPSPPPSPTHRLTSVVGAVHFIPIDDAQQPPPPPSAAAADVGLTLPFVCRVGRSVLSVSPSDRSLLFDHCIPNTIYHRQVALRNLSELPASLHLHLRTDEDDPQEETPQQRHHRHHHHHSRSHRRAADHSPASALSSLAPPPVFEVTDVDSGKRVIIHSDAAPFGSVSPSHPRQVTCLTLPPFAVTRLRLSFRPPALTFDLHRRFLGEHSHSLSLINQADTSNVVCIALHTVVSADRRAAGLLILPPSAKVQSDYKNVARAIAFLLNVHRDRDQAIAMAKASTHAVDSGEGVGMGGVEGDGAGASPQGTRWGEGRGVGAEGVEEAELSEIDFGLCYTGSLVARIFSLHNKTGEALEVHLSASAAHAKGEVTFHYLQDVYDGARGGKTSSSGGNSAAGSREGRHRQKAATKEVKAAEPEVGRVDASTAGSAVHPLDDEHSVHLCSAEGVGMLSDPHGLSPAASDRRILALPSKPTEHSSGGLSPLSISSRIFSPSLARIDSASSLPASASPSASSPSRDVSSPPDGLIKRLLLANERTKEDALRSMSTSLPAASDRDVPSASHVSPQLASMSPLSSSVNFAPLHLSDSPSASFIASGLSPVSLIAEGRGESEIALDLQTIGSPGSATSMSSPPQSRRPSHHFPSPTRMSGLAHTVTTTSSSPSTNPSAAVTVSSPAAAPDARSSRVEVIVLPPGRRQDLMVTYRPEIDAARPTGRGGGGGGGIPSDRLRAGEEDGVGEEGGGDDRAYALQPRKFRVTFDIRSAQSSSAHGTSPASHPFSSSSSSSTFTKRLRATARACQSFVSLERDHFDFGDVNLGTKQAASVRLFNHSDLPAQMEVSLASQSVRVRRMALQVAARASHDLKFDFIPRKVNPRYHKAISIANVHNPTNLLSLRLSAVIIDEHKVLFHSTFYQLTSPTFPELDARPIDGHHHQQQLIGSDRDLAHIQSAAPPLVRRSQSFGAPLLSRTPPAHRSSVASASQAAARVGRGGGFTAASAMSSGAVSPVEDLPSALHLLHFGRMVENNPWVRVFNVTNLASAPIELQWSSSDPAELRLMQETIDRTHLTSLTSTTSTRTSPPPDVQPSPTAALSAVSEGDEGSDDGPTNHHTGSESPISFLRRSPTRASMLPLGSPMSDLWLRFLQFCKEDAQHNHDEVPSASPSSAASTTAFPSLSSLLASTSPPDPELLRLHCRKEMNRRQDLQKVLSSELLTPLSILYLAPFQTVRVYVVWTIGAVHRPWMSTKLRSLDAEIQIQLTKYPQPDTATSRPPTSFPSSATFTSSTSSCSSLSPNEALPPRCLPVQSLVCRSVLDVSQKHFHFGVLTSMDRHEKQLVLHNQSEVPLLFALRKTGSIASSDLIFPSHSLGVVRPYGHLEIPFIFKPSLAGAFNEPLTLENLQDTTNQAIVSVKAHLRKPLHFWLKGLQLDFGFAAINPHRPSDAAATQAEDAKGGGGGQGGGGGVADEGEEEDEEDGEGERGADDDASGDESTLTQWIVLKNISSKPRTFKAQLRSIRLVSSRSKADILELTLLSEQQLQALSRQRSTESVFRSSASSSSLRSPDGELSPSPPFSGTSSPRVSVHGDGVDPQPHSHSPVPISSSTPSLQSLTHLVHPLQVTPLALSQSSDVPLRLSELSLPSFLVRLVR